MLVATPKQGRAAPTEPVPELAKSEAQAPGDLFAERWPNETATGDLRVVGISDTRLASSSAVDCRAGCCSC